MVKTESGVGTKCIFNKSGKFVSNFSLSSKDSNSETIRMFGFVWLHNTNRLLAGEEIDNNKAADYHSNLVIVDTSGKLVKRLILNPARHFMGWYYPDNNDDKILFTESYLDGSFASGFSRTENLNILSLAENKIELRIDNFNRNGDLLIAESPWSPDGAMFVYSIGKQHELWLSGHLLNAHDSTISGSYIFDLNKKKDIKFIEGSKEAVWNSTLNLIAYIKDNSIWLYDLNNDSKKLIFSPFRNKPGAINNIHWTPDGKFIYINGYTSSRNFYEKLIDVDGNQIKFKPLNLCNFSFSWK